MSIKQAKGENKCIGEPLYIELSMNAKNCRNCCICIPGRACVERFMTCLHPLPPQNAVNLTFSDDCLACVAEATLPRYIHNLPTRSKFALFQGFLNFLSNARMLFPGGGGGGMCMLFETCEKRA